MNLIDKAARLAIEVHSGMLDKAGVPMIFHPFAVAAKGRNDAERILGLLHDVIEDSPEANKSLLLKRIYSKFGDEIGDALDAISRRVGEPYMAEYLVRVSQNSLAHAVKIYDLGHNSDLSRIPVPSARDYARLDRYHRAMNFLGAPF